MMVVKAYHIGDLKYFVPMRVQEFFCFFYTHHVEIVHKIFSCLLFEQPAHMHGAEINVFRNVLE